MNEFCDTGKIQYGSEMEAKKAAATLARHDKKNKYSHYCCFICKMYHTTTVKKNRKRLPRKADKYPLKFTLPKKEENAKRKRRKK